MLRILYRAGWAAARVAAALGSDSTGKLARSLRGRLSGAAALTDWARAGRLDGRPLLWLHAASVGEGRQAEAVLRLLRARRPHWQILFTYSSSSAEQFAAALPVDYSGYLPADVPHEVALAFDAVRPDAIVFSATDIWPRLAEAASDRGIRLGLISATMAPTSTRRLGAARLLLAAAYRALDRVGAIDRSDADALLELGVRPECLTVTGDTRHDAADSRAKSVDRSATHLAALWRAGAPLVVAGSTWPADERRLLPAFAAVRETASARLVIAPHEPTDRHLRRLDAACRSNSLATITLSDLEAQEETPPHWDVCLVNRVGILADLYAAATVAYVGGGFHGRGLHSVIEPAAFGVPVVFGPRWRSSRDARLLLEAAGARAASSRRELAAALGAFIADEGLRAAAGQAARGVVDAGLGAAERTIAMVLQLIEGKG